MKRNKIRALKAGLRASEIRGLEHTDMLNRRLTSTSRHVRADTRVQEYVDSWTTTSEGEED